MYLGANEWTISRNSRNSNSVFVIYSGGYVESSGADYSIAIRPCFYLTSTTQYVSVSGTSTDPFRIQ